MITVALEPATAFVNPLNVKLLLAETLLLMTLVLALWVRYEGFAIDIMEIPASVHTKCIEMIHLPKLYLQNFVLQSIVSILVGRPILA